MKPLNSPEDEKLQRLLRGTRPAPGLPPRFKENVWRRIETREVHSATDAPGWLSGLAGWLLRPRLAFALAAAVMLAGVGLGWNSAQHQGRHDAQARYLAAVVPNSLR